MTDDNNDIERRRFFRIDDEICMEISTVSEQTYENAPKELNKVQQSAFAMSASFASLNHDYLPMMNSIRSSHPEIAQYLDLMNKKMDNLSQHILEEELPCTHDNTHKVNISASGISFDSKENFTLNQPLMLRLVLLPDKIGIEVFGRVVNIQPSSELEEHFQISIDFEHIRSNDQELLIRHNLNKQMKELREKSGNE